MTEAPARGALRSTLTSSVNVAHHDPPELDRNGSARIAPVRMRRRTWSRWSVLVVVVGALLLPFAAPASARPAPQRLGAASLTTVVLPAPVPAEASAAFLTLAMTDATGPGYITADRCSSLSGGPQVRANGNYARGSPVSNVAVVRLDSPATFCVVNQTPVNLVADAQGWFGPAGTPGGLAFVSGEPRRVLDTRGTGQRPGSLWITSVHTGASGAAAAVLANISMVDASGAGYVTADRCSTLTAGPQARANGNHPAGGAVSNLSIVPVDSDGRFCIFSLVPVDLVVDVQGELVEPTTGGLPFAVIEPARLVDTRTRSASRPPPGSITRIDTGLGARATAALVNIAMVEALAPGYVTADRCSTMAGGPQARASGNHAMGAAVSNLTVVALDPDGAFCVYAQSPVHLVVDLQGAVGAAGTQHYHPIDPVRALDTRPPGGEPPDPPVTTVPVVPTVPGDPPLPSGTLRTSCTSVVHIGDSTSVGMISTNVIPEAGGRLDAQYRRVGVTDPRMEISGARSIVETLRGQVNARETAARVRVTGYRGCWVFALGTTDTANLALAPGGVSRRERIDRMMTVAAGEPVLWVNTRTTLSRGEWSDPWMQLWNSELRAAQSRWPNLEIYDWSSVALTRWFSSDGVHYTSDGYGWRGILIANALATTFPA